MKDLTIQDISWKYGIPGQTQLERNLKVWYYYHHRSVPGPILCRYEPWNLKIRQAVHQIVHNPRLNFIVQDLGGIGRIKKLCIDLEFEKFLDSENRKYAKTQAQLMREKMEAYKNRELLQDKKIIAEKIMERKSNGTKNI